MDLLGVQKIRMRAATDSDSGSAIPTTSIQCPHPHKSANKRQREWRTTAIRPTSTTAMLLVLLLILSVLVPPATSLAASSPLPVKVWQFLRPHRKTSKGGDWLRWMVKGRQPRGTDSVILREAEALGGLPRGDRYSSRDWFHNTVTLPNSGILKAIRSPVLAVTSWATFLSLWHNRLLQGNMTLASKLYMPTTPHSLMMSALGLLLVFRTNSAYQRFAEGRKIWENVVNNSRDLSRMVMLYETEIGKDKKKNVLKLLVAFPYLLRHRVRPNLIAMRRLDDRDHKRQPENTLLLYPDSGYEDNDPEAAELAQQEEETGGSRRKKRQLYWVDKRALPWRLLPGDALEKCARAQNRPLWVCDRMSKEIKDVPDQPSFTARERLTLLRQVDQLSKCIGGAERIHQTAVPLNYARHTLRALTLWLFSMPFAILKDLGLVTGPALFVVAWLLFGVYEIGYAIGTYNNLLFCAHSALFAEDPFQGSLRLSVLCDSIRRDVLGDESTRSSAFRLTPTEEEIEEDDTVEGVNGDDGARRSKTFRINWSSRPRSRGLKTPTGI